MAATTFPGNYVLAIVGLKWAAIVRVLFKRNSPLGQVMLKQIIKITTRRLQKEIE